MPNIQKTILLIEDEPALLSLYQQVLKDAGFKVIAVSEGEIGFDTILDSNWDLLLLDIMLPKKDGLEILKELKDYDDWKKGKVIMMTNLNSEEIINNAFDMGADGYLIKSEIQPDKLIEEVKGFLSNKPNPESSRSSN